MASPKSAAMEKYLRKGIPELVAITLPRGVMLRFGRVEYDGVSKDKLCQNIQIQYNLGGLWLDSRPHALQALYPQCGAIHYKRTFAATNVIPL